MLELHTLILCLVRGSHYSYFYLKRIYFLPGSTPKVACRVERLYLAFIGSIGFRVYRVYKVYGGFAG